MEEKHIVEKGIETKIKGRLVKRKRGKLQSIEGKSQVILMFTFDISYGPNSGASLLLQGMTDASMSWKCLGNV